MKNTNKLEIGEKVRMGTFGDVYMVYEGIIDGYHAFMKKSGDNPKNISSYRVTSFKKSEDTVIVKEFTPIIEQYLPSHPEYSEKIKILEEHAQNV